MAKLDKDEVKNLEKIKVKNLDGTVQEAEILLCFELESTGKNYILYTFNEVDEKKMETIHASTLKETEDGYQLDEIPDEEWKKVKEVMREVIRSEE